MAGGPVVVEGVDAAQRAYQAIADDAHNLTEPHRTIARAGQDAARARAPVARGILAGSIDSDADDRAATITIGVDYWPYQEFGTRYVTARRFGRAAIEAMIRAAPDAYRERLAAIIRRRGG